MKGGVIPGLVIGIVVDVNDEENQGRIRAKFPWLDDQLETIWIPLVSPFAGPDRGLFMVPEVGDEVVVGFLHGDFNHPVVLGSMWNGQAAAPSPDPRQRMIRSKNGHTIRFIDSTPTNGDMGALFIGDAHGNYVLMSNTHVTIHSRAVLQLTGQTIVLNNRVLTPNDNPL